jgi:hypothetical protein
VIIEKPIERALSHFLNSCKSSRLHSS